MQLPLAGEVMGPLPVRRRLTVLRDGSIRASDLVFCSPSGCSVPLARCATCGFGGAVALDTSGCATTVECSRFRLWATDDERLQGATVSRVAAILPVGLSLVRPAVCLTSDAPLRVAVPALARELIASGIAVVDEQQRLVGVLPRAEVSLALADSMDDLAADHMTADWRSVTEGATFGAAFGTMAATHARELIVLGRDRTFVGVVRDIDALRFVAHVSRTGLRPELP
jgi:CBS-domain-containing membrane protein